MNRSKLDVLYHDLLGDITSLMQSIEAAQTTQRQLAQDLAQLCQQLDTGSQSLAQTLEQLPTTLGLQLHEQLQSHTQAMHSTLQQALQHTQHHWQALSLDQAHTLRLTLRSSRQWLLASFVISASAGALGGLLAGIALARDAI